MRSKVKIVLRLPDGKEIIQIVKSLPRLPLSA